MSHFSQVKTHMTHTETLKKILKASGFEIIEDQEGVQVRGYFGETQSAEFKILTRTHYDIGFKKNEEGSYELIGDWELMPKVADIEQKSFTNWLKREYAKEMILKTAQEKGYEVEQISENENGEIQLVVSQW